MSGIASKPTTFVELLRDFPAQIAATRKTTSEEFLEKRAVFVGEGLTHRLGLDNFIMIKDCHLDVLKTAEIQNPIKYSIKKASYQACPVEIEVAYFSEALICAKMFYSLSQDVSKIIMLDNMSPDEIIYTINFLKNKNLYNNIIFEASGRLDLDRVQSFAKAGVDVLSTSKLTEGVPSLNLHQKVVVT